MNSIADIACIKGDRILVKSLGEPEVTRGGLYVPMSVREDSKKKRQRTPWRAEVVKFGDGVDFGLWGDKEQPQIAVGDTILVEAVASDCPRFIDASGAEPENYAIITDEDVIAKVIHSHVREPEPVYAGSCRL